MVKRCLGFFFGFVLGCFLAVHVSANMLSNGAELVSERCSTCHDLSRVHETKRTAQEWELVVDRMYGKGARMNIEERAIIIEYLGNLP